MEEYLLEFRATNGHPSRCRITLYRDIHLVIASETGEGASRSAGAVTNAAEIIATEQGRLSGREAIRHRTGTDAVH